MVSPLNKMGGKLGKVGNRGFFLGNVKLGMPISVGYLRREFK